MNNGVSQVFYVHKRTKTVINLADLRCMPDEARVIVSKDMYDEKLNISYIYRKEYKKMDILTCKDWDIVQLAENLNEKEQKSYDLNKRYINACKKYNYIGYDIDYPKSKNNNIQLERSFY